jgi:hypothetical protein
MHRGLVVCALGISVVSVTGLAQQTPKPSTASPAQDVGIATQRFFLHADGGAVLMLAGDPANIDDVRAIQLHLQKLATAFGQGDFRMPHDIHAPSATHATASRGAVHHVAPVAHSTHGDASALFIPGAAKLARLKSAVRHAFTTVLGGGRLDIYTTDAEALPAVHEFLRYQISTRRTGDSTAITRR